MGIEYTSFTNEHTCEYVLIPSLTNILKKQFKYVIPIFPWITREGNKLSHLIHEGDKFKVIGLFPRRPKLNFLEKKFIIKINNEILETAKIVSAFNIPMIAGCPMLKNLWEFDSQATCLWVKLTEATQSFYEIGFEEIFLYDYSINHMSLLSPNEMLSIINSENVLYNINDLFEMLKNVRINTYKGHQLFGPVYKLVYFLLKQ